MVESAISIVVVGVMLVAALNTISASAMGRSSMNDRARGQLLAMHLMSEILQRNYEEPVDPVAFGPESSESGGSRALYDDVDDYHGWTATPPESMNGIAMPDLNGWERGVVVEFVDPNDLTSVQLVDLGVKRITVTVKKNNAEVATMVAIRANGLEAALGRPMDALVIE